MRCCAGCPAERLHNGRRSELRGYTWNPPEEEKQYDFVTKIDHVFNSSNSAFFRYSQGEQNTSATR